LYNHFKKEAFKNEGNKQIEILTISQLYTANLKPQKYFRGM